MVAPSAADVATVAPVSALSASGTGAAAWPRGLLVVLLLDMISSFALCERVVMPRPGRDGPGVRIAVQRASSMDALRAKEVRGLWPTTFRSAKAGRESGRRRRYGFPHL